MTGAVTVAIAYVREVATFNNTGTTASFDIAVANAPNAGNAVFVIMRCSPSSGSGYSATFSDSKGNTWATDFEYLENFQYLLIASTIQDVGTLTTSDTITFTLNMTRSTNACTIGWVEAFSGVSVAKDGTAGTAAGSGTTLATATKTPSQGDDLAFALIDTQNSTVNHTLNDTATVGTYSAFTTGQQTNAVSNSRSVYPVYQILSGQSGVGQKHAWGLSASTWADRLNGLYKITGTNALAGHAAAVADLPERAKNAIKPSAGTVTAAVVAGNATVTTFTATNALAGHAAAVASLPERARVAAKPKAGTVTATATAYNMPRTIRAGTALATVVVIGVSRPSPNVERLYDVADSSDERRITVLSEPRMATIPWE